ncbi:MAG: hypothetical protein CVV48_00225 [Spirochaetae bacterium HGW-Spirochaetae-4]|nr:MAG: hypothetical protein CVV48_00225 [Spirochaetae bacterium HGW-Spirochaetae-4]
MFIRKLNRWLHKSSVFVLIFAAAIMSLSVFIQIISRNIFSRSFENFEELPRFLLIWITFLGAAYVFGDEGHLGVEFFVNLLPQKIKKIADLIATFFNILFMLLLIVIGGQVAFLTMVQKSIQMGVPVGLVYLIMPISGVIMLLIVIERFMDRFQSKSKNK